jgi:hypothetical protein
MNNITIMNMTKSSLLGKKTNGHNHNDNKCDIAKHVAMISHMNTIIMTAIAKHHQKNNSTLWLGAITQSRRGLKPRRSWTTSRLRRGPKVGHHKQHHDKEEKQVDE